MNRYLLAAVILPVLLVGCSAQQSAPQPEKYKCMKIDTSTANMKVDFAATIESSNEVYIYPLATGYVVKKYVEDGDYVKKGDVLIQLDARELKANMDAAESQVKTYEAELAKAELEVKKLTPLVSKGIISTYELETAQTTEKSYRERLDVAKSQLRTAQINYGYATIRAPQSGYISSIKQKVGELIVSGTSTPITKIAAKGEYRAYFTLPEDRLLTMAEQTGTNDPHDMLKPMNDHVKYKLIMANGQEFASTGELQLGSSIVEASTGTLRFRAVFKDESNTLFSGGSGKVRAEYDEEGAIVIPESACYEVQDRHMVLVLGEGNTVVTRNVTVEAASDKQYVVRTGLARGETILLEGVGIVKAGTVIEPVYK